MSPLATADGLVPRDPSSSVQVAQAADQEGLSSIYACRGADARRWWILPFLLTHGDT
jgi:hypothetical protein